MPRGKKTSEKAPAKPKVTKAKAKPKVKEPEVKEAPKPKLDPEKYPAVKRITLPNVKPRPAPCANPYDPVKERELALERRKKVEAKRKANKH